MRAVLLRIVMEPFWSAQVQDGVPRIGFGFILIPWLIAGLFSLRASLRPREGAARSIQEALFSAGVFCAIPLGLYFFLPERLRVDGIPVFGYGFMLFVGITTATWFAVRNGRRLGLSQDTILDMLIWLVVPGIAGGRLFYVVQKHYEFGFLRGKSVGEALFAIVNLPDGGLVFYGAVLGGLGGFLTYCYRRRLNILQMGDVILPSLFVGLGFGRIGCFLYGCCFGGTCELPWAVTFPRDSVPYNVELAKGYLTAGAPHSLPLHPTQLYSSINAFLLATVLTLYLKHRPYNGAVLAIGWVVYPITRFVIEMLRSDEAGLWGTPFTVSQWISMLLFVTGVAYSALLVRTNGRMFGTTIAAGTGAQDQRTV